MANQDHVDLLRQSAQTWNQWRKEHPGIHPDLSGANLTEVHLASINLSDADLEGINFDSADLRYAKFQHSNLNNANLTAAFLSNANFSNADLSEANLRGADLDNANLSGADIRWTNLWGAKLNNVDLRNVKVGGTHFDDIDLRTVNGLETVEHKFPSPISITTIYHSGGTIPEVFLRKAGVPDSFIEYMRSLIGKPIEYYSCFISYSSRNQDFAERLYADLQSKGVRCWFAPEDLKIGDKRRDRIDEAVRMCDKLLLVLSEHSVQSVWVEREVEAAFEKEHHHNRLVLFPVRLDDAVMQAPQAWAADIRRMRHIGDFRGWKNHDDYKKALDRLIRDLKAEASKLTI